MGIRIPSSTPQFTKTPPKTTAGKQAAEAKSLNGLVAFSELDRRIQRLYKSAEQIEADLQALQDKGNDDYRITNVKSNIRSAANKINTVHSIVSGGYDVPNQDVSAGSSSVSGIQSKIESLISKLNDLKSSIDGDRCQTLINGAISLLEDCVNTLSNM